MKHIPLYSTRSARTAFHRMFLLLASALTLATAAGAGDSNGAIIKTDGSALGNRVAEALRLEGAFSAPEGLSLSISASAGLVRLSGSSATIFDRHQAARTAEGVAGVTGISPSILIRPGTKVDESALETAIVEAVKTAGVAGPDFSANVTEDGIAHLGGEVFDEWVAVNAARRVRGVSAIVNYDANLPGKTPTTAEPTLVERASKAENPTATAQAQELLSKQGIQGISVRVEGNVAILSGRARSLGDALSAPEVVTQVPTVLGIRNEITIPARHVRPSQTPDDGALTTAARRALARYSGMNGITFHAVDGRIYLSGRVNSAESARAAITAAASVPGVQEVVSVVSYPTLAYGS